MKPALFTPIGAIGGAGPGGTLWTPTDLGIKLLLWWTADTVADGALSSWASSTGDLVLAQATGTMQPVRSATALDSFPGVTFDGVDDFMEVTSTSGLPTGTTTGEIWVVAKLVPPPSASTAIAFAYGSSTANVGRRVLRASNGVARVDDVTTVAQSPAQFWDIASLDESAGANVVGGKYTTGGHTGRFNGIEVISAAAPSMNTATTRARMGSHVGAAAGNYWPGPIRDVLTTLELTADEQLKLEGYLAHRSGIGSKLPADHPWKVRPPTV